MLCGDAALENIAEMLHAQTPQEIIAWTLQTFEKRLAVVTAFQAEGLVVLDMAYRLDPTIRVMTIDTGRLPHDTYAFIERVRQHYPTLQLEILFPDSHDVEPMVQQHGINLFYQAVSLRHLCCHVRKVHPFQRAIQHLDAWFTGLWAPLSSRTRKSQVTALRSVTPLAAYHVSCRRNNDRRPHNSGTQVLSLAFGGNFAIVCSTFHRPCSAV